MDHFEEEIGGDLQGLGADLVDGVLGGVVVAVGGCVGVGAVVDVDEVEDGDAALGEGEMVVFDADRVLEDVGGVAGVLCGLGEQIEQPGGGVVVASMLRSLSPIMSATRKALILEMVPSCGPLGGEMAGAVEGVGGGPGLDGLFTVVEDQPDAVALGRMGTEVLRRVR